MNTRQTELRTRLEELRDIRALLVSGWTQNASARDAGGNAVHPTVAEACAWCVFGAFVRVTGRHAFGEGPDATYVYITRALPKYGPVTYSAPSDFNDNPSTTHEQVLALLDVAADLVERDIFTARNEVAR